MSKVVVAMSMSLDGIAGPESADADGMAVFSAILGWQFPLRSWRAEQGTEGGEDSVDSRAWAENFARFGPQIAGCTSLAACSTSLPRWRPAASSGARWPRSSWARRAARACAIRGCLSFRGRGLRVGDGGAKAGVCGRPWPSARRRDLGEGG
jgi:hypothetical protein